MCILVGQSRRVFVYDLNTSVIVYGDKHAEAGDRLLTSARQALSLPNEDRPGKPFTIRTSFAKYGVRTRTNT